MIGPAGTASVDPQHVQLFFRDATSSAEAARAADGNQAFFCAMEDGAAGRVLFYERWRDQSCLDAYLSRPEVQAIFRRWGHLMTNDVRKFDADNERDPIAS